MQKNNHILAEVDESRSFKILTEPITYKEAREKFLDIVKGGSEKPYKIALVNLRSGVIKRGAVRPEEAPKKKVATKKVAKS